MDSQAMVRFAGMAGVLLYIGLIVGLHEPVAVNLTAAAVFVASLLSALAGFAFSALCGAMIFQFRHDPIVVVQIMLLCSLANQSLSVWLLRRDIDWRQLQPFLLPGGAGVLCGVFMLLHMQVNVYIHVLGFVLFLYGVYMLVRRPITLARPGSFGDAAAAFCGGIVGGLAAMPGTPVSIWCAMKGWDKTRQRAVFQPFIMIMQIVALVAMQAMSAGGSGAIGVSADAVVYIPAGLIGTIIGIASFRRMTGQQFHVAMNLLIAISGVGLLIK